MDTQKVRVNGVQRLFLLLLTFFQEVKWLLIVLVKVFPWYFQEIFGLPNSRVETFAPHSEFGNMGNGLQSKLRFAINAAFLSSFFRKKSEYIASAFPINASPKEKWVFVNGLMADKQIVLANQRRLQELFERPIDIVFQPMRCLMEDILVSTIGRNWGFRRGTMLMAALHLRQILLDENYERLIIITHSQVFIMTIK